MRNPVDMKHLERVEPLADHRGDLVFEFLDDMIG